MAWKTGEYTFQYANDPLPMTYAEEMEYLSKKKEPKKAEIEYAEEGRWYPVENMRRWVIYCCDCALCHRYEFRVSHAGRGHKLEYRVFRLDKETAAERRRMDKKGEWRLK